MRKTDGFTLAEILITLAILGIVIGLSIPNFIKIHDEQDLTPKDTDKLHEQTSAVNIYENRIRSGIDDVNLTDNDLRTECSNEGAVADVNTQRKVCITQYKPICKMFSDLLGENFPVRINIIYYRKPDNTYVMAVAIYRATVAPGAVAGMLNYYVYKKVEDQNYDRMKARFLGLIKDIQTVYPQVSLEEDEIPQDADFQVWTPPQDCNSTAIIYDRVRPGISTPTCEGTALMASGHSMLLFAIPNNRLYICGETEEPVYLTIDSQFDVNPLPHHYNIRAYDEVWLRQMIDRKIERNAALSAEECAFAAQYKYREDKVRALCTTAGAGVGVGGGDRGDDQQRHPD